MLNKDSQLIGKAHYAIKPGAVIEFDQFNEKGELVGSLQVTTAEDIVVWLENEQVRLSGYKNVDNFKGE